MPLNETHDPNLTSWVESANDAKTDFPIQNLPFATRARPDEKGDIDYSVVVPIGDSLLDLNAIAVSDLTAESANEWSFFGLDAIVLDRTWSQLRRQVQRLLAAGNPRLRD